MPRKKGHSKKSKNKNKSKPEAKVQNSVDEDLSKADKEDTISLDSRVSATSSVSVKKRFSFRALKKKKLEEVDQEAKKQKQNDDSGTVPKKEDCEMRRSNSLNLKEDSKKSKIPLLKRHGDDDRKHGSALEISPRSQKTGNFDSSSLVLNPGMDSWRMAGLMDNVTASSKTSLHSDLKVESGVDPPSIALGSSNDVQKPQEELKAEVVVGHVDNKVATAVDSTDSPPEVCCGIPQIDVECVNEITGNTPSAEISNDKDESFDPQQACQPNIVEDEIVEANVEVTQTQPENLGIAATGDSCADCDDCCQMENEITDMNASNFVTNVKDIGSDSKDKFCEIHIKEAESEDVVTVKDDVHKSDKLAIFSDNECALENEEVLSDIKEMSSEEKHFNGDVCTYVHEVYEIENNCIVSVRELADVMEETKIEMPLTVCCDDWLVLEYSRAQEVSS